MSPIKIIHTSDVHLDSRYRSDAGDGYRNHAERAFATVIDLSIQEAADLLLIVGDLFDHNRVREEDFEFVCTQLARTASQVVVLPGNHDQYDDESAWHRIELQDAGHHVHAMLEHGGRQLYLDELDATIWGKAMFDHAPENEPLKDAPPRREGVWNIGLAHGLVVPDRAGYRSSQITHAEIGASGFDYLALGHVHVWGDMSQGRTTACYPGSPVAAYASVHGGHVAIANLCPERGVRLEKRQVDRAD